jgi:hypothetical protein
LRYKHAGRKTEKYNREGEITFVDTSEIVPGEVRGDLCDMPCCENKLQFQIWGPNGYRTHVGIHPNARDPERFVRNGITRHERKSSMSYDEAEAFFDLTSVVSGKEGVYDKIIAVSQHLHNQTNHVGSRPLEEAVNPVFLWAVFEPLAVPQGLDGFGQRLEDSANTGADVWVYDTRLFDAKKGLTKPLTQLEKIPEGIIPCMDTKRAFRNIKRAPQYNQLGESFCLYGIVKPLENKDLLAKGLSHFLDIRHVHYHAHEHWWGESGIGFSDVASFHEE